MSIEGKLVRYVEQKKIERCELCHNKMEYIASGVYRCTVCGSEVLDDFGKVKLFLEENGPTPQIIIAQRTGVSMDKIDSYLKRGMLEIPNGSNFYLRCEKCKCEIRYGKYCPECATKELNISINSSFEDVGERPKKGKGSEMKGKMHFSNPRGR